DVALHHHRVEGLVDAAAGLEDDREERTLAEFGDPELDVAGLGGQRPGPVAVAFDGAVLRPFVGSGADPFGRFELDQLLERDPDRFADQVDAITGAECVEDLGQGRLGQGHRWDSFSAWISPFTPKIPPMAANVLTPRRWSLKPHHSQGLLRRHRATALSPLRSSR